MENTLPSANNREPVFTHRAVSNLFIFCTKDTNNLVISVAKRRKPSTNAPDAQWTYLLAEMKGKQRMTRMPIST